MCKLFNYVFQIILQFCRSIVKLLNNFLIGNDKIKKNDAKCAYFSIFYDYRQVGVILTSKRYFA